MQSYAQGLRSSLLNLNQNFPCIFRHYFSNGVAFRKTKAIFAAFSNLYPKLMISSIDAHRVFLKICKHIIYEYNNVVTLIKLHA